MNDNNTGSEYCDTELDVERVDCVVIGAGVVGLAVARELSREGRDVIILETTELIGSGISSRNSEVIHAGIYYAADSLKAKHCVRGRDLLYRYCADHHIPHSRCGKLIVATQEDQLDILVSIRHHAQRNGVTDITLLLSSDVAALEPSLRCVAALNSPSTGIVDIHAYMLSLLGEAQERGAMVAFNTKATSLEVCNGRPCLTVTGDMPIKLDASLVVNSAGLGALDIAYTCPQLVGKLPRQVLAKGHYFSLVGKTPVSRLIYPVPEPGGLGVHITLGLDGRARFGPDVEWVDDFNYDVDSSRADRFYSAIRRYWPELANDSLVPDYAGIRPKIAYHEEVFADFVIAGPADHGVDGLINLLGIESPGLTSSLAIAEHVSLLANNVCVDK